MKSWSNISLSTRDKKNKKEHRKKETRERGRDRGRDGGWVDEEKGTNTNTDTRTGSGGNVTSSHPSSSPLYPGGGGGQYAYRAPFKSLEQEAEDRTCRITNFEPVQEITQHTRCITAIRMSSDCTHPFIVTAGLDCQVFVTDFFSGEVLKKIDTDNSFIFSLAISADNSVFATAAQDGCVRIYSRARQWQCDR
jgi:WD40 repeat protein